MIKYAIGIFKNIYNNNNSNNNDYSPKMVRHLFFFFSPLVLLSFFQQWHTLKTTVTLPLAAYSVISLWNKYLDFLVFLNRNEKSLFTRNQEETEVKFQKLNLFGHITDYYFSSHLYFLLCLGDANAYLKPMDSVFKHLMLLYYITWIESKQHQALNQLTTTNLIKKYPKIKCNLTITNKVIFVICYYSHVVIIVFEMSTVPSFKIKHRERHNQLYSLM